MATHRTPPWEKPKPKPAKQRTKLTPANVKWAKARAKKAGRRYPNLVDNMTAARRQSAKKSSDHPGRSGS